ASEAPFADLLLPPPPPPAPITVAAGIMVTLSRATGSPKTSRALSASRIVLNASFGSTGAWFARRVLDPALRELHSAGRSPEFPVRGRRLFPRGQAGLGRRFRDGRPPR